MIELKDEYNNSILINDLKQVFIKLPTESSRRLIGQITPNNCFRIMRNRSKHLFLRNNSYGFNYHILSNAKKFDTIILRDEVACWKIPVSFILENGKFLFFKQQGFEKQIFIQLEQIKQFKINYPL